MNVIVHLSAGGHKVNRIRSYKLVGGLLPSLSFGICDGHGYLECPLCVMLHSDRRMSTGDASI